MRGRGFLAARGLARGRGGGRGGGGGHGDAPRGVRQPHFEKRRPPLGCATREHGGDAGDVRDGRSSDAPRKLAFARGGADRGGRAGRGGSGAALRSSRIGALCEEVREDGLRRHQRIPAAHGDALTAICVADDAVYTSSRDGTLKRWRPQRSAANLFELAAECEVPLGGQCWCMVAAGEWVFCGLSDGRIRAFSKAGQDLQLSGHTQGVSAMLPHQSVLLSGSAEGAVRCWSFDSALGAFVNSHTVDDLIPGQVRCLTVMGSQLWVGGNEGITLVDLASLSRAVRIQPLKKVVGFLEFQAHMIAAYADGSMRVFDAAGVETHAQKALAAGPLLCIAGLETGPRVLCAHARGNVSCIGLPAFELKCSWRVLADAAVRCVCSARHDGIFIIGGENGDLQVWQRGGASSSWGAVPPAATARVVHNGAPLCASGHLCASNAEAPRSHLRWRCSVCGIAKQGERWSCGSCDEDLCFKCFPNYNVDGCDDSDNKESIVAEGRWVHVRKHSGMGCAVVTFQDVRHRRALLAQFATAPLVLGGIRIEVKPHMEKKADGSRVDVPLCAFLGWKQAKHEGACRLRPSTLQVHLDRQCDACCPVIALD